MVAAAVVVAMFEPAESTDGGTETMCAGRQRREEVEEAGYKWVESDLAGVNWKRRKVYHRPVGGTRRTWQLISRERLPNVGRD